MDKIVRTSTESRQARISRGLQLLNIKSVKIFSNESYFGYYLTGIELLNQKQSEDAAAVFLALTKMKPHIVDFWIGLGTAEFQQLEYQEALKAYNSAMILKPLDPRGYYYYALTEEQLGNKDKALKYLDKGLSIIKNNDEWSEKMELYKQELIGN
jgi:tetratricopeptide (TPR) repeat protein